MYYENKLWMASVKEPGEAGGVGAKIFLNPAMANRHGLIAGATGTGKTITLKVMAESFSDLGVPVFLADIKGDLSGMCVPGETSESMEKRIAKFGIQGFSYQKYPTCFWDIYGEKGNPVRTTILEMGPLLLGKLLELNDTQMGVLNIAFRIADEQDLLLLDMKDLRSMLTYVGEHAKEFTQSYGNISAQTVGAIQRALLTLEDQGGDLFFGEPALDILDWLQTENGRGMIHVLHCVKLINNPALYSTFLLWLLSTLFEQLPEAGDLDKPKLVFFFDEAHLLFQGAPQSLLEKVEQVVKLIRSKGVGVFFITQNPSDIPDGVLSQLGNRIQHALHAYTPADQKAVKSAAQSFRENPAFKTEEIIGGLGIGEALVSFLDENGAPAIVEQAKILPPQSLMGPAEDSVVDAVIHASPFYSKYSQMVDRDSAYEKLEARTQQEAQEKEQEEKEAALEKEREKLEKEKEKARHTSYGGRRRTSAAKKAVDTFATTVTREATKGLMRGIMGLFKR